MLVGGGIVAVALIGVGAFLAGSRGSDTAAGSVTPVPVVIETATAVAAPPQSGAPEAAAPQVAATDFAGSWAGSVSTSYENFTVQLDLDQSVSGKVSGTVTSTNRTEGTTASWYASGYLSGDRVVLTPDGWITQPNANWRMDTVKLVDNGSTLTASFIDPRDPGTIWGTTTLS